MTKLLTFFFGRTAKNTYLTTFANVTYGLLLIGFFILASRFLGPERFGEFSIALAFFTIGFDVLNLGTNQALIRFVSLNLGANNLSKAKSIIKLIFKLRLAESVFLILAAYFLGRFFALQVFHNPNLVFPVSLALVAVSGLLFLDFFNALFQAWEQFTKLAFSLLSLSIFRLLAAALLIYFHSFNLLTASLVFFVMPAFVSLLISLLSPSTFLSAKPDNKIFSELFHFSKWMALWSVTATLAGRFDVLLMGKLTSIYETGIYSVASRVATGYIVLGGSLSSVLTPKISRLIADSPAIKRLYWRVTKLILLLFPVMIIIALLSHWFIPVLFGSVYQPAVPIFYTLTLGAIFFLFSIPSNVTLLALGHARWLGFLALVQLIILIVVASWLIPSFGGQGAAFAMALSYLATYILTTIYAFKTILA